jgi:acyl dehydratase
MPLRYPDVLQVTTGPCAIEWSERDTILYALAVGLGESPLDAQALRFLREDALVALPTLAATLARAAYPDFAALGVDYTRAVHVEQSTVLHGPLPARGSARGRGRVSGVHDAGPGKGAVIELVVEVEDAASGRPLATGTSRFLARADGGFGGPAPLRRLDQAVPERAPDRVIDCPTRLDQALLYRLLGDPNPLHADPAVARAAGFPRPILHGLCTYGITCAAVLQAFAGWDPGRIRQHQLRFCAPVFPGETLAIELWQAPDGVTFRASSRERGVRVVDGGRTVIAAAP